MKKIIILSVLFSCLAGCFGITTEFDSNGLIVNGYGNRRFTDGQTVSFDYFQEIRIFSAIELDNWNIVKKELTEGIGINWKVKVNLEFNNNIAKLEYSPLQFAITKGKEGIARKLIERGAKTEIFLLNQVNGNTENHLLSDEVFNNVFITKTLSDDFLMFYLNKRSEQEVYRSYGGDLCIYAGIHANAEICLKMLDEHLKLINDIDDVQSKEKLIYDEVLSNFIPNILYGCIFSDYYQHNKQKTISSESMDFILNIIQSQFGKQYTREISEQFKLKVMPMSDETFEDNERYKIIREGFLKFCK
ncbi:MAG: hypothetical protein K2M50_01140 [Treponemataceae bacterium]|nr:hypothetical protein [Treponemataceae bacterium]